MNLVKTFATVLGRKLFQMTCHACIERCELVAGAGETATLVIFEKTI
jgi:hypothetical protein